LSVETLASGRYRVERVLGDGAMATVVLARDEELDRLVAVKLLDERLAADESFRARFAREARVAAALSHPNVVTVFDVGESDGRPFIVMEHVEGRTLEERLRREGPLPADEVRRIARQVCAGLEHAHAQGLIHRDLKPANLIERGDGTIKIADFGIARAAETTLTEAGTILGTAAYLAPEQAEGREVTQATDLYGLGVVLYELLTGKRLWEVESLAALASRGTEPAPEPPPDAPADLRAAIARCLAPDAADRPTSAGEVADLLDDQPEEPTVVLPGPRRARARRRWSPATWAALLAGLLLLGLGAFGLALTATGDDGASAQEQDGTTAARVEPIPDGATPAEDARNLSDWLRENSG
jgi:serine/threonine-protein kinase